MLRDVRARCWLPYRDCSRYFALVAAAACRHRPRAQWFLELLDELGIECRMGHPAKIRAAETQKQKQDRRDALLILDLLTMEDRFPAIWMPSTEQRDWRTLLAGSSPVFV